MKKSFKKLGFVSLATNSMLLGSTNATDLETYVALQKPSHVFGNYAAKTNNNKKSVLKDGKESGNSGDQASQQQAQKPLQVAHQLPETPPAKEGPSSSGSGSTPSSSGSSVASQLVKDTTTVNSFKSVSVSGMNTTLSGVETMSK